MKFQTRARLLNLFFSQAGSHVYLRALSVQCGSPRSARPDPFFPYPPKPLLLLNVQILPPIGPCAANVDLVRFYCNRPSWSHSVQRIVRSPTILTSSTKVLRAEIVSAAYHITPTFSHAISQNQQPEIERYEDPHRTRRSYHVHCPTDLRSHTMCIAPAFAIAVFALQLPACVSGCVVSSR